MTCPDCTKSSEGPWYGFRAPCQGCKARSVSRSPYYFDCQRKQKLSVNYIELLQRMGVTHEEAKAAQAVDKVNG